MKGFIVGSVVVGAACSGANPESSTPTVSTPTAVTATTAGVPPSGSVTTVQPPVAELPSTDALGQAFDSLTAPDGSWNLDAVLAVFAARIGTVPGITPAAADLAAAVDDQYLADILSKRLDELTPEQRAVVQAWLEPGPVVETRRYRLSGDAIVEVLASGDVPVDLPASAEPTAGTTLPTMAPDPTAGAPRRPSQAPDLAVYATSILGYLRDFKERSGVAFDDFEVVVGLAPLPARVGAAAIPEGTDCKVTVSTTPGSNVDTILAHESYHCFQFALRVPLGLHP